MSTLLDLMSVPEPRRDASWLLEALRTAVMLELSTLPPYLTAKWSIIDQDDKVADTIDKIVRQEMMHMGLACNIMNALKTPGRGAKISPKITDPNQLPIYPGHLPGNVNPDLIVPLERISKSLVHDKFMEIEKPEFLPVFTAADGQPYPTIGAFYDAVSDALLALDASDFENPPRRQRVATIAVGVKLTKVTSQIEALRAISLIKKQGEGTAVGPYFDPARPETVAHYFRFGEIYYEHRVKVVNYKVVYNGDPLPFPTDRQIHQMAPVPKGGYKTPDAMKFNQMYSGMLRNLEAAWSLDDDTQGQAKLKDAVHAMNQLYGIARTLMSTPIAALAPATYGPGFVYLP